MKKKNLIGTLVACMFALAGSSAYSGPSSRLSPDAKKALLAREALAQAVAPIKSKEDLERYLKIIPPKSNALNLLSPAARERFIATLTFNEKGLTGFGFEDLQRELSQDQIVRVLALFGSESSALHIKLNPVKAASPRRDKNGCIDGNGLLQPIFCEEPYDGGLGDGGGFGGGGGYHPHPKPQPLPPPDPRQGQVAPIRLDNGDIYHMSCASRATCMPNTNMICKAGC